MNAANLPDKLRIDKYLWSVRLFKTRAAAAEACDKGKVKFQGASVKPSRIVHIGDQYEVKTDARKWVIQVTGLLPTRVAYSEAVRHYLDLTPAEELERIRFEAASFHTGKRLSKIGRPTKKERRDLGNFMGEDGE